MGLGLFKGKIDWKPGYDQSGIYEFKITAIDDDPEPLSIDKIFKVEVKNVNRKPKLVDIKNQVIKENDLLPLIDFYDLNTGSDNDIDQEKLSYKCFYDNLVDGNVEESDKGKKCSSLRGLNFDEQNLPTVI